MTIGNPSTALTPTRTHKLCCVVNEIVSCPFCEYITCEACNGSDLDDHGVGDIVEKSDVWFCPKEVSLLKILREPTTHLAQFIPTEESHGQHRSNISIQEQLQRAKSNA